MPRLLGVDTSSVGLATSVPELIAAALPTVADWCQLGVEPSSLLVKVREVRRVGPRSGPLGVRSSMQNTPTSSSMPKGHYFVVAHLPRST